MEIRILGPLKAFSRGEQIRLTRGRERELLAILAVNVGRGVSSDVLIEAIWADQLPKRPRSALQTTLSRLRNILGTGPDAVDRSAYIRTTPGSGYVLDVDPQAIDAQRFQLLLQQAQSASDDQEELLRRALQLWQGDPLDDFRYREWAQSEIARLEELKAEAIEHLAEIMLQRGNARAAIPWLRSLVITDPLREGYWLRLMRALAQTGQHARALQAFVAAESAIRLELGAEPGPELVAFRQALVDGTASPTQEAVGIPDTWSPADRSADLIGRDAEVAAAARLARESRVVSLVGDDGIGKTRMAASVASRVASEFPDGVLFVSYDELVDGRMTIGVLDTESETIRRGAIRPARRWSVLDLVDYLRGRRALLVLDGCRQLVPTCRSIIEVLLAKCPRTSIIQTSREPVGIADERVINVEPLALPGRNGQSEALQLFVERAVQAQPDVAFDDVTSAIAEDIVTGLDGNPLAIELTAAKLADLDLETIAGGILEGSEAPSSDGGPGSAAERAIAWSYEQLPGPAREALDRLSIFQGSWTLDDAKALFDEGRRSGVQADLVRLIDASLVMEDGGVPPRFRLLDTVRHIRRRHLTPELHHALSRRHARHFRALAAASVTSPGSVARETATRQLAASSADVDAAFVWMLNYAPGPAQEFATNLAASAARLGRPREALVRLARTMERMDPIGPTAGAAHLYAAMLSLSTLPPPIGNVRGGHPLIVPLRNATPTDAPIPEGAEAARGLARRSAEIFQVADEEPGTYKAVVVEAQAAVADHDISADWDPLHEAGTFFAERGDHWNAARAWIVQANAHLLRGRDRDAVDLAEAAFARWSEDPFMAVWALETLARVEASGGRYDKAAELVEQAMQVDSSAERTAGAAHLTIDAGVLALFQHDLATAERHFADAQGLSSIIGYLYGVGYALCCRGLTLAQAGDLVGGRQLIHEGLITFEGAGDRTGLAMALAFIGVGDIWLGKLSDARDRLLTSLSLASGGHDLIVIATGLSGTAYIASELGDSERAITLVSAADGLYDLARTRRLPFAQHRVDRLRAHASADLGPDRAAEATAMGSRMSVSDAVALAGR